jgi:hypothetical protein
LKNSGLGSRQALVEGSSWRPRITRGQQRNGPAGDIKARPLTHATWPQFGARVAVNRFETSAIFGALGKLWRSK